MAERVTSLESRGRAPGSQTTSEQNAAQTAEWKVIVVGASAGGVTALQDLVSGFPADLRAAVFVVLHIPAWHRSELPEILSRSGRLKALHPEQNQAIVPGYIYVAPPNAHLHLEENRIHVWRGPKENLHRPAINPLFRSAAVAYRDRVIGAILSGNSDDGATGLWWVKRFGGTTVVQDDPQFPDMPQSARDLVEIDYSAKARDLGPLLAKLASGDRRERRVIPLDGAGHYGKKRSH